METTLVPPLVGFFFVIQNIKIIFATVKYGLVFILAIPQVRLLLGDCLGCRNAPAQTQADMFSLNEEKHVADVDEKHFRQYDSPLLWQGHPKDSF